VLLLLLLLVAAAAAVPFRAATVCQPYVPAGPNNTLDAADMQTWLLRGQAAGCEWLTVAPGRYAVDFVRSARAHVTLAANLSDIVLDMRGVTLVMNDRDNTALYVSNWANVTLRGLTIMYAQLPTNQATILNISQDDEHGDTVFDVVVPKGYPIRDWHMGKTFSCNVYAAGTRYLRVGSQDLYPARIAPAGADPSSRRFLMTFDGDVGPSQQSVAIGDTLGCRNPQGAFGVTIDGCSRSNFHDFSLLGAPSFGFFHGHPKSSDGSFDQRNGGGNTFLGLQLTYPERPAGATVDPVLSASADGFHVAGVPVGPTIESCLLEGHNDDGIALHGHYSLVTEAKVYSHGAQLWVTSADYAVGDVVKIYNTDFLLTAVVIVIGVGPALPNGHYQPPHNVSKTMPNVQLLPEPGTWYQIVNVSGTSLSNVEFDFVAFNTNRSTSGFTFRNNTIRNHRARGMLIKASNGLVERNRITNSSLGGIIITPELSWGEGDYVSNLRIVGNTITSVCTGKQCYGGLGIGAKNPRGTFSGGPPYGHSNIQVSGNRFENISQMNIWVTSTQGIAMTNNTVAWPFAYPPVATCCPPYPFPDGLVVWVANTSNATFVNNCVVHPSNNSAIRLFEATSSVVNSTVEGGWRLC